MEPSKDSKPDQNSGGQKPVKATFPRSARLLKPADFNRVFKKPTVSADRYFKVLGRMNESGQSRLGMAVSRQVDKHAVGRNRIKRLLREHFRHAFPSERAHSADAVRTGIDLVVLPRRECASMCNTELTLSFAAHCSRLVRALERKRVNAEKQNHQPGIRRENQDAGIN